MTVEWIRTTAPNVGWALVGAGALPLIATVIAPRTVPSLPQAAPSTKAA